MRYHSFSSYHAAARLPDSVCTRHSSSMRFALSNGSRVEATPGARGLCPRCASALIAKCGEKRIWHWAHKGGRHCDHWWENETEWHRNWKANFPKDWQEVTSRDEGGERHIADVMTPSGIAVEFQRSPIAPLEVRTRTEFYKSIVWVVDGTASKRAQNRFAGSLNIAASRPAGHIVVNRIGSMNPLVADWGGLGVAVAFDFGGENIWLLRRVEPPWSYGYWFPKEDFVNCIKDDMAFPDAAFTEFNTLPSAKPQVTFDSRRWSFRTRM